MTAKTKILVAIEMAVGCSPALAHWWLNGSLEWFARATNDNAVAVARLLIAAQNPYLNSFVGALSLALLTSRKTSWLLAVWIFAATCGSEAALYALSHDNFHFTKAESLGLTFSAERTLLAIGWFGFAVYFNSIAWPSPEKGGQPGRQDTTVLNA